MMFNHHKKVSKQGENMLNFYIVQLLGLVNIATTVIGLSKREKSQTMLWFTFSNIVILISYILLGRYLASLLILGVTVRTFVYFIYSYRGKKIPTLIYICINLYLIILSILLWKDFYDLILLANLLLVTYTTWKNNQSMLRLGYLFSAIFLITYDIAVGAYVSAISDLIMGITSVISIYNYDFKNRIDNIVLDFYQTIASTYKTTQIEYDKFKFIYCQSVDDSYNNFCYLPDVNDFASCNQQIIDVMTEKNRKPAVYIQCKNNENAYKVYELMKGYELLYHDVWMQLEQGQNIRRKKCLLQDIQFCLFDDSKKDEVISVFDEGFVHTLSSNIYKYSEGYTSKYQEMLSEENLKKLNIKLYCATLNGKIIGILFVYHHIYNAYLCQITTLPEYRRKGVASSLMNFAIKEERKLGMENFYLVTEKMTYLENFYMKNNFKEISQGYCVYALPKEKAEK